MCRIKNASLVIYSVILTVSLLETGFNFIARSNGNGATFSARVWFNRYWKPINSLGFRDDERSLERLAGRKKVLVLGDSFAAGWGIKDYRKRFSNILGQQLGAGYAVMNAAVPGEDTGQELETLRKYPFKPDAVVLAYYLNDIEPAAGRVGMALPEHLEERIGPFCYRLQNGSALFSYLFWTLPHPGCLGMNDKYLRMYSNAAAFAEHEKDLQDFIREVRLDQSRLLVVLFPLLSDLEGSRRPIEQVSGVFRSQGVRVVDVSKLIEKMPMSERIVNNGDAHPSESVHEKVADALYGEILRLHLSSNERPDDSTRGGS